MTINNKALLRGALQSRAQCAVHTDCAVTRP